MKQTNKKLYQSVAALVGFVFYLAVIMLIVKNAVPLWTFALLVAIGVIYCAVFAYRAIAYCSRLKQEAESDDKE